MSGGGPVSAPVKGQMEKIPHAPVTLVCVCKPGQIGLASLNDHDYDENDYLKSALQYQIVQNLKVF